MTNLYINVEYNESNKVTKFLSDISDEDTLSNRAKRSPVFPGYDVVQWKIIPKGLKKKAKKKFKKVIKVSPFVALKAAKKTPFILKKGLKFVPPAALLGGALGGSLGGIGPGLAGAAGAIGLPALLSAGGGGGAAAVPTLVSSAMGLFGPAIGLAG